jgi:omega-6 fatty acid desaturase (delta-12 desaturase)
MQRDSSTTSGAGRVGDTSWRDVVAKYQQPSTARALWQLASTLIPYALLWYLIYHALEISLWLALPLALLAAGFAVRLFIIFHDCGHGSFLGSRRANDFVGVLTGVLTFCPYYHWRWQHGVHHGTAGQLDRRGTGDVWTMTVREYLEASRWRRWTYRLARNPLVLFVLAPLFIFVIYQRFPAVNAKERERRSVWRMNFALAGMIVVLSWIYGVWPYLLIQSVVMGVAGAAGIFLFYVQHQFEDAYWEREADWDYTAAALRGSSFYKLPKVLQWFSGNIGFHHVHHLSPRIPNYNLQKCHEAESLFQQVKTMTIASSLRSLSLRLWDEQTRKLVGYAHLRRARPPCPTDP